MALDKLGYSEDQIRKIIHQIEEDDTIETSKVLKPEHLPVFDCAFKPTKGKRSISYLAHIRMMAAVQPFISGAISKTVNMPNESTVENIKEAYMTGWRLGLKALAIYRDGSKRSQPVSTKKTESKVSKPQPAEMATVEEYKPETNNILERRPQRVRLPQTRSSITHKFDVAGHEGYLTVGLYEDGQPGELFITMAKEGSTVGGLMDSFGTCVSLALQYGVPLSSLVAKFSHSRFEPAGMTSNRDIPFAKSLIDYIARWLGMTFLPGYREANAPKRPESKKKADADAEPEPAPAPRAEKKGIPSLEKRSNLTAISGRISELIGMVNKQAIESGVTDEGGKLMSSFNSQFSHFQSDAPVCDQCGSITVRNGNCYRCHNCGSSMGCS